MATATVRAVTVTVGGATVTVGAVTAIAIANYHTRYYLFSRHASDMVALH